MTSYELFISYQEIDSSVKRWFLCPNLGDTFKKAVRYIHLLDGNKKRCLFRALEITRMELY